MFALSMKFTLHKKGVTKMILDDLKNFIVQNSLADEALIKYDYDSSKGDDVIVLNLYDSRPCDLARRSGIKITIKLSDLELCRDTCFALHDLLFPQDSFQKAITINGKTMHATLNSGPYYLEKDSSKRHCYVLDITITYNR